MDVSFQLTYLNSRVFRSNLIPFLDIQPSITELDIFHEHTGSFPVGILPNLSILSTKPSLAFFLLPGRSVTHLYLYISEILDRSDEQDSVACSTLRNLSLDQFESLGSYERCFSTLEFLELSTVSDCFIGIVEYF